MKKTLIFKILLSGMVISLTLIGLFDFFNITVALNTLPSKVCIPISVQPEIGNAIKLLKEQRCDLQYVIHNKPNSKYQDRLEQLQISYLIYHNQKVFDRSPFSTIRRFELLDAVNQGDLEAELLMTDATINIQESTPFYNTVHEVNHLLVRQITATSYLNLRLSPNDEQKFFTSMIGTDYMKVVNRKLTYQQAINAFGSSYPVSYEFFKTNMIAGSEVNSTLVEQYLKNPTKWSPELQSNIQRMETFTDRLIAPGYHSDPRIKSILANPALNQSQSNNCTFTTTNCQTAEIAKVKELESLITQLNSLSSSQPRTSYIHLIGLSTYIMIATTNLFLAFILLVKRVQYGNRTKSKNQKTFTIF
jgi:hypothetical protein